VSSRVSASTGIVPARTEGPRAGGHLFTVTESVVDTSMFTLSINLPNGYVSGATFVSVGSRVYAFHDGGSGGSVFTTCVVADTGYGSTIPQ